ncbi:MAG: T9SS type A sorting domain-containing protein [Candidatus Kapabacteria bacterium]|nr:T9SS type A sorting domain-containing protein [Candidatus Kapabacteria bacterium]
MKHLLILLLVSIACARTATAQIPKPVEQALAAENIAEGTEFFIAIPPNEILPFSVQFLSIFLSSAYDTEVVVSDYTSGKTYKRSVKKGEVRELSDKRGETNWTWELRNSEVVVGGGIALRSAKPISVFVMNSKTTTSDGYMAIPTSAWGREYLHVGYYDFKESRAWAGGFVVVAKDSNTTLNILLRGTGKDLAKTAGGNTINTPKPITVTLNPGDVYMVKGDGTTRGVFDLTGTKISSDKPVGVISFHERTTMPNLLVNGNGRNHLVEMLAPTSKWGTSFVSLELPRESLNGTGTGDVFRVVASEANTQWTLKYYDEVTGQLLGQAGGTLEKAGDVSDLGNVSAPTQITNGFAIWETTKPAFIMQYSCSSSFDGDITLDPFMFAVQPVSAFSDNLAFNVCSALQFDKSTVSLVVKIKPGVQDTLAALRSLTIDGVAISTHANATTPKLLTTRMPNGLYWCRIGLSNAPIRHVVASNDSVLVGGYVFGRGQFDAYGWNIGAAAEPPVTIDTLPPLIVRIKDTCGILTLEATELRNIPDPPIAITNDTNQVESGIAMIDTVKGPTISNYNYKLTLLTNKSFPNDSSYRRFQFQWSVVDKLKAARVEYFVRDFANNKVYDTLIYQAPVFADTLPPDTFITSRSDTRWSFTATEQRNRPQLPASCPESGQQRESGLAGIRLEDDAINLRFSITSGSTFPPDSLITRATFVVDVIDTTVAGSGIVTSTDRAGNSTHDTLRFDLSTSVTEGTSGSDMLTVAPNPASDQCRLAWTEDLQPSTLEVIDLNGKLLISQVIALGSTETTISTISLLKGLYTVVLKGRNETATQQLIIQ